MGLTVTTDNSTGLMSLSYESEKELTSAEFRIYYENESLVYSASTTTISGSFSFVGDNSTSYLIRFLATATDGDTQELSRVVSWTGSGVQPERLPLLPTDAPDWLKNALSVFLIILAVIIMGAIRYDIACVLGTLMAVFLWYTGNLKIEGIIIAVLAIIALAAVMHRARRE
jgi:hypothetical protein